MYCVRLRFTQLFSLETHKLHDMLPPPSSPLPLPVRFEVETRNADGDTPALVAASRGNINVLNLLVDKHGANVDAADSKGAGLLHKACRQRQTDTASMLLEAYGLPADKPDLSGATPLHLAAQIGDAPMVELLTGSVGRADLGLRDGEGNQALHVAAALGHLEVVKVMVEKARADLGEDAFPFFSIFQRLACEYARAIAVAL